MKKTLITMSIGILVCGIILLVGCTSTPTAAQTAEFEKAVREIFAIWIEANLNEDADSYVAVWDEDYVKMAAGKNPRMGLDVLRESKIAGWKKWKYEELNMVFEEFQLAGQFGWAYGSYEVSSRPAGGGDRVVSKGTYLTIFKKQPDGSWKVYRDTMMNAP